MHGNASYMTYGIDYSRQRLIIPTWKTEIATHMPAKAKHMINGNMRLAVSVKWKKSLFILKFKLPRGVSLRKTVRDFWVSKIVAIFPGFVFRDFSGFRANRHQTRKITKYYNKYSRSFTFLQHRSKYSSQKEEETIVKYIR